MRGRGLALGRAFGAFGATLVLVFGVPYLLVRLVGNPFPSQMPTVDEIRILLTQNGQGFTNFLIGTLAVIIWLIWAQLVVALAVEVAATIRQSETRRIPAAPGIQALAARLIAGMALATTLVAAPLMAPAVGALSFDDVISAPPAATVVMDSGPFAASQPYLAQLADQPLASVDLSQEQVELLTVADHTELWDLADAAYGDGVSWKLIAHANAGSFDASGSMITSDTESVAPGTQLRLPAPVDAGAVLSFGSLAGDAAQSGSYTDVAVAPAATDLTVDSAADHGAMRIVEPGDSMWTVAEHEVQDRLEGAATDAEVAEYWAQIVQANSDVASGDVDLIFPGEELVMPGRVDPGVLAPAAATAAPATLDTDPTDPALVELAPDTDVEETSQALDTRLDRPADRLESGDGSEPDVAVVRAPQDTQIQDTEAQHTAAQDTETQDIEQHDAEPHVPEPEIPETQHPESPEEQPGPVESADDNSVALPAFGLAATGAALLSAGVISALRRRRNLQRRTRPAGTVARPASSDAAAFEAAIAHASHELRESQRGVGWRMMPAATVAAMRAAGPLEIHADASGDLAAVASVCSDQEWSQRRLELGADEAEVDEIEALVERPLEQLNPVLAEPGEAVLPTTVVLGTDEHGEAVLLDLASVGTLDLVGDENAIRRVARTAVLDLAVSDRADDLRIVAVQVGEELADLERVVVVASYSEAHAHIMRSGHAGPDSLTPVVVVSAASPNKDQVDLVALRETGALIIAPGLGGECRMKIEGDQATMTPSGTAVRLVALTNEDYRAVVELVETTSPMAIELVDEAHLVEDVIDVVRSDECPIEAGPIEVRVLGPVEIAGADSFSSLKAVDVVAYLAFHRHGVDADQIKTWVWPAFEPPTDKAFANVMSRARTGLGTDDEGSPFLSRAGADKTYRLAPAVTTDFDRFRALVELADAAAETTTTLSLLRQAIELIRGVPFTGGAASSFSWADNHVRAQVEYTIDEAVHHCADLALEIGDLATARWAALKGHELVPGCEQCFRRRFLIAGAGKNRSELRRAMADLEASAMVDLGEPEAVDMISGDLLDLYHQVDKTLVSGSVSGST